MSSVRERLAYLRGQFIAHVAFSMRIALVAVGHNKLRASLTSLGILFGVASVIAMLAIGKGAEQEILEQMRLLGSNNVIVTPLVEQKEEQAKDETGMKEPKKYSPGLTFYDADAIRSVISEVETTSSEVVLQTSVTREGRRRTGKVVGVDTTYFRLLNLTLASGDWFNATQVEYGRPVAIVGHGVRTRFFTTEDPIGKPIKAGDTWLTVVGVLDDRTVSKETSERLGVRDPNMDVFVPLHTMLGRFRNRAQLTTRDIEQAARAQNSNNNDASAATDEETRAERTNYHQLDRIVVRVKDAAAVPPVAEIMQRMLARRHNNVIDFEITVPELLLKQEQRTKTIFNIVLGAIASISLIVGGIGIMNIMLASVLERIKEIGVRRAMGATRKDILAQFLSEAVLISVAGGVAGILLGGGLSFGIERIAGIRTLVSAISVFVAFGVSFSVGLLFGIVPAYRAARQDPVVCLRYE
ncbi:MAG: Macrolide export ATP-binding/permease protein MacB [Gemmatimonadaceae bacterium]|nr:Macrolide export ATP-binding/permease protein MacB [Gemmatimonadaceae bacterium]